MSSVLVGVLLMKRLLAGCQMCTAPVRFMRLRRLLPSCQVGGVHTAGQLQVVLCQLPAELVASRIPRSSCCRRPRIQLRAGLKLVSASAWAGRRT